MHGVGRTIAVHQTPHTIQLKVDLHPHKSNNYLHNSDSLDWTKSQCTCANQGILWLKLEQIKLFDQYLWVMKFRRLRRDKIVYKMTFTIETRQIVLRVAKSRDKSRKKNDDKS